MPIQQIEDVSADSLLGALARVMTKSGGTIGVTLNVKGQVIDGLLVSRERWLDELKNVAGTAPAAESARALLDGIALAWESDAEEVTDETTEGDQEPPQSQDVAKTPKPVLIDYLHLLDVDVAGPEQRSGMAWRVRLSEVSAWSLQSRARDLT